MLSQTPISFNEEQTQNINCLLHYSVDINLRLKMLYGPVVLKIRKKKKHKACGVICPVAPVYCRQMNTFPVLIYVVDQSFFLIQESY